MFERFTDRSRRVVVLAQAEARSLNHNYIGTEHLLLGLLAEREGIAAQALQRLGISIDDVRARVEEIIGHGGSAPSGHIPFTPRAKKVLELALRESLQLGHNYIGTEHILLGLIREGAGVAAQVLGNLDIHLSRVGQEVLEILSGYAPPAPSTPPTAALVDTPAAIRAREEARRLAGDGPLGTHHVLTAIARDPESLAAKALGALGVTPEALETELARLDRADTSDELPEEAGARRLRIELRDEGVAVVVADEELRNRLADALEGDQKVVTAGDAAARSFPTLWQDLMRDLGEITWRLEKEAVERWRPPEWQRGWDVAAYMVIQAAGGVRSRLDVAEGVDRQQVRSSLAAWLVDNQPKRPESATYLAILVRTGTNQEWTYELSFGDRRYWPRTQGQYLVTHAIFDLAPAKSERRGA